MKKRRLIAACCFALACSSLVAQENASPSPVITAALMEANVPFTYADAASATGQSGLLIEILDEIFKQVKVPYAVQTYPWARAQAMVENGRADFLLTVPTPERMKYADASAQPVFLMRMQVFALKDHPRLDQIKKIGSAQDILAMNLTPISNLGNGWHKANIDSVGVQTTYGRTDESAARMLAYKRGDILIDSAVSMAMEIKRLGLSGSIVATGTPFPPLKFHLLISKQSKHLHLMPRIDQAIATLTKNGTLERLSAKYTKLD